MAAPGMLPKLATDAIPGHTVTPQELFQYGAGFNKFGKAGEDIGKQITGSAVKSLMPMSPEATAELAMKHAEFQQTLQQRADAAKMRSEDMRLSVDQRAEAARMHDATMRELAAARREAAAAAGAGEKGNMAVEGASLDGNTVVRNTKTGIAHEVINGVPSPEPYKGPVTPKTDQAKGVAVAAKGSQGLKDMTAALNAVEADPDIYGPRATAGAALPNAFGISRSVGGLTPEQQTTRANISSMTADVTHSLYGSAFSAGEQARAKGFLIDPLDDAKTVKAKLRGRMELEQDHYNNLPASAKAAATARQGGGGAAASGGWGKAEKG
jgi:hypothetical protein